MDCIGQTPASITEQARARAPARLPAPVQKVPRLSELFLRSRVALNEASREEAGRNRIRGDLIR
jgi:hypothetical protein